MMKMRKVFLLILICFLMTSLIAEAQIITVGVTADIFSFLELHFNDASVYDWFFIRDEAATTISWDGTAQTPAESEGDPNAYLESSIYMLRVWSTAPWDLTIAMPDYLETAAGDAVPLTWQFGENSALIGTDYSSGSISIKNIYSSFSSDDYIRYLRFRIPYYWKMAPGEYQGTGTIKAFTI